MAFEIDEGVLEKYLMNCLDTQFIYHKYESLILRKILIVEENLCIFESPSGDVCDDTIFTSWACPN